MACKTTTTSLVVNSADRFMMVITGSIRKTMPTVNSTQKIVPFRISQL
jgi:hypothetical protein